MRALALFADGVHIPRLLGCQPAKAAGVHEVQVGIQYSCLMPSLSLIDLVLLPRLPSLNQHMSEKRQSTSLQQLVEHQQLAGGAWWYGRRLGGA